MISFNGGKDAVAALHLYRAALARFHSLYWTSCTNSHLAGEVTLEEPAAAPGASRPFDSGEVAEALADSVVMLPKPCAVYFHAGKDEFPEVQRFVEQTAKDYCISLQ